MKLHFWFIKALVVIGGAFLMGFDVVDPQVCSHRGLQPGSFLGAPEPGNTKFQVLSRKRSLPGTFQNISCTFKQEG